MADNKLLQQMLECLVNDEQAKAEELFHEYVVAKSRDIYESLIESEMEDEKDEDEDEEVEEGFEEVAIEADDETPDFGGDATDDLESDIDAEMGDEGEAEEGEEQLFQDLEDIVDELQAKFDELKGIEQGEHGSEFGDEEGEDEMGGDEGGNPFAKEEGIEDLETVREYVEQVGGKQYNQFGKMGDNGVNTKSAVAGKNDMGGTTANILRGGTEKGVEANKGQLQGSSLIKQNPQEDNAGNINVPGGKAGKAFSKKEPGHGAEKAGAKETADNKQSLFRGRR